MELPVLAHSPTISTRWNWSTPFPSIPPIPGCPLASRGECDFITCWRLLWPCPHPSSDSPRAWQAGKGCWGLCVQVGFHWTCPTSQARLTLCRTKWRLGVSPAEGHDNCRQSREAGTGRRADQAAAQATCRARMRSESLLASFFHAQVVDADKHSGTSCSDALLCPEARGGPGQSNQPLQCAPSPLDQMLLQCFPGLLLTSQRFNCSQVQWPPAGVGLPAQGPKPEWPKHSTRMLT